MTREEVLQRLEELRISISGETLRRWVNAELVPMPERGNKGRAGGRWSEYPPETPWEAFAAAHLLANNSIKQVAEIREKALGIITEACWLDMQELNQELKEWQEENTEIYEVEGERGVIEGSYQESPSGEDFAEKVVMVDTLAFVWLMARIKAEYNIPLETPAQVHVDYFGYWEENNRPHFVESPYAGFPNSEDFKDSKLIVEWRIDKVNNVADDKEDEIVIRDVETEARIILWPWKSRKAKA